MAATTLGFIPLQLIPTNAMTQYSFDKGFPTNGTYVVVKTPTVAQQLQLTKSIKEMNNKEVNNNNPAPEPSKPVILRCKRRVDFTGLGCKLVDSHNPSVSRRNERERKRVKMVNMGFETLRQHVPSGRKNKKMSKVETLRSAVQYIKQLQDMLDASDAGAEGLDKIDMSELESKVTELIQNAANSGSDLSLDGMDNMDNMDTGSDGYSSSGMPEIHTQHHSHQAMQQVDPLQAQLQQQQQQQQQQQLSPASSQGMPTSPQHHQVTSHSQHAEPQQHQQHQHQQHQFYQTSYSAAMYGDQYETISSSDYSQASPAGSLHSPTSSVVSDSSYDSVGDSATPDDDDILSGFTNWF